MPNDYAWPGFSPRPAIPSLVTLKKPLTLSDTSFLLCKDRIPRAHVRGWLTGPRGSRQEPNKRYRHSCLRPRHSRDCHRLSQLRLLAGKQGEESAASQELLTRPAFIFSVPMGVGGADTIPRGADMGQKVGKDAGCSYLWRPGRRPPTPLQWAPSWTPGVPCCLRQPCPPTF